MKGKLFLLPTYLSEKNDQSFIAPMVLDVFKHCEHYLVENIRTARRFISDLQVDVTIDALHFYELKKGITSEQIESFSSPMLKGEDMAILSEAGLPCLADPGSQVVSFAHQKGVHVIPLPGASSIQMALIGSGFNGQNFTFHGYLPKDKILRIKKIKFLEKELSKTNYTQIFMETPYRNQHLLTDVLENCHPETMLGIASDISGQNELIQSRTVANWKNKKLFIHKIPTIFTFGKFS